MEEREVRTLLRRWILQHSKKKIQAEELTDTTPVIDSGLLSSLDIAEFVLYIESLRGSEIDVDDLDPEVFVNVDTMWQTFFRQNAATA